jgi:hypothetical protein
MTSSDSVPKHDEHESQQARNTVRFDRGTTSVRYHGRMKTALNFLTLVYPPVSNQEAEWLKQDVEVEEMLRRSDIYMIGQRREAKFVWGDHNSPNLGVFGGEGIRFRFEIPGIVTSEVELSIENELRKNDTVYYDVGEKHVRCSLKPEEGEEIGEVLWWYSTESLLFAKWRGDKRIKGLDNYRDFTNYDLHYVGISTEQDSYQRLLANAHHKRVAILSNETQYVPDARLTDEICLFFFRSSPLFVHVFDDVEEFSNFGEMPFTAAQASADAEKAFNKLLEPEYNTIKFKSFPKGKNGLYDAGLARYAHSIDEDITFHTATATFRGSYDIFRMSANPADAIIVSGDEVDLYRYDEAQPEQSESEAG